MSDDPNDDARVRAELERFAGDWIQVARERDGVSEPRDEEAGWQPRTTFAGHTFTVTIADGSVPIAGTFTLDPTRTPQTIDYTDTVGADAGKTFLAIYRFDDDDHMMFCAAAEHQPRPTTFATGPGQVLRVNVRVR